MCNGKSRILIVEDHPIVIEGYRVLIHREVDLEVAGVASSILEALKKASLIRPHLTIVDLVLQDGNGLDLIKDFHVRFPEMKQLVVSAREECDFAERALHAGAAGYLNKIEATTTLIDAIHNVLNGKIYLSSEMTNRMLQRVSNSNGDIPHSLVDQLADRELEAFELIGRGLTTKEIANQMHISPKTVDRYRENIKDKLDLPNAIELLRLATIWVEDHTQ